MTTTDTPTPAPAPPTPAPSKAVPLDQPLPELPTSLPPEEITRRLDLAARRGRLPGYSAGGPPGVVFELRDFGTPFEGVLQARHENQALRFTTAIQRRLPIVAAVILLLSIWPGVWFTESALASIFTSAEYMWKYTYWWYLPLAIPSAPWAMWALLKKSRTSIHAGAHELIAKIEKELSRPA